MSSNPYEPPTAVSRPVPAQLPSRRGALWPFRAAFVILLLPALFNYYAFDLQEIGGGGIPSRSQVMYRTTNFLGFAVGSILIWFFAFPLLELVAQTIRSIVARHVAIERWQEALYTSLKPAVYFAIPGAALWAAWVVGFYYVQLDFVAISYGIGIPAHLLAAGMYVPLIVQWNRLSRAELPAQRHSTKA